MRFALLAQTATSIDRLHGVSSYARSTATNGPEHLTVGLLALAGLALLVALGAWIGQRHAQRRRRADRLAFQESLNGLKQALVAEQAAKVRRRNTLRAAARRFRR